MDDTGMVYVAQCAECGSISGVVVDEPKYKKDTAKDVAEFVESGRDVKHITLDEFREKGFSRCDCGK